MEFHINQEIVCIESHPSGIIQEGQTFVVKGLKQAQCTCNHVEVDIGFASRKDAAKSRCTTCNAIYEIIDGVWWFRSTRFRPLDELEGVSQILDIAKQAQPFEV